MANFLISYDLHRERNYTRLYQLMAAWNAVRLTESQWMACLVGPANVVRDFVVSTLDHDDTVTVVQLYQGTDWATSNASAAACAWLSGHVTPAKKAA
jgi:hypothetical protein